jgi:hypothetical protein
VEQRRFQRRVKASRIRRASAPEGSRKSAKLWARYPCATHARAIVSRPSVRQTSPIMDTKSSILKGEGKSEKLSLLLLGLCIAALVTILIIRPF